MLGNNPRLAPESCADFPPLLVMEAADANAEVMEARLIEMSDFATSEKAF
jgi:hypothetical protein